VSPYRCPRCTAVLEDAASDYAAEIALTYGYTLAEIRAGARDRPIMRVRYAIVAALRRHGYTQTEIAKTLGRHTSAVQKIEGKILRRA
jgi:DNA-directed RNA polymerase specialized sigma subunit